MNKIKHVLKKENAALEVSLKEATQAGNTLNHSVDDKVSTVKNQDPNANVTVKTQTVSSGDGSANFWL